MRDALLAQDRPILYSLCDWGQAGVQEWGNQTGHSWRSTGDIYRMLSILFTGALKRCGASSADPFAAAWKRVLEILNENSFYLNHVNFYGRSDPDMLEVGNAGLSAAETRTHFAFWAAMKSPLLMGTDLSKISNGSLAILKNPTLLAFSQDNKIGVPATPYKWGTNPDWTFNASFPAEYWSGSFHDKKTGKKQTLAMVLNDYNSTEERTVSWSEVPQLKHAKRASFKVTDGWTGKKLGCFKNHIKVNVASHDTAVLVIGDECERRKE